jgi:hypothetical protein
MNSASIRYDLQNIDNLRYLLCLAREFFSETGMIPAELEYHGVRLSYNSIEANAVIKGALDEKEYIERNLVKE